MKSKMVRIKGGGKRNQLEKVIVRGEQIAMIFSELQLEFFIESYSSRIILPTIKQIFPTLSTKKTKQCFLYRHQEIVCDVSCFPLEKGT